MKAAFHTLGCKVNQYETQAMRRLLEEAGYQTAEFVPGDADACTADVLVVNSCTVTGESDRKLRQLLRRCRRDNPTAALVLTGCMPQAFPESAADMEADVILGNAARRALPDRLETFWHTHQRIIDIPAHSAELEPLRIDDFQERTRAFVKIQDGCNRFCSYCIIPYARGRVRSKPLADLREELETLAAGGFREVVLVGINLTAYGQEWGLTIADAVETAAEVEGLRRIRLGSLEPDAMTPDVIARLAAQPKLCPQFHLALQSGCDATLRRMNRRYTTAEFTEVARRLRAAFPDAALTTDVMVGFPGETEEEFRSSLQFVQAIAFSRVHVFAYSRRPGTPADRAPNQIPAAEKTARSHAMLAACEQQAEAFAASYIGRTVEVLLETAADGWVSGYTPNYLPVQVRTDCRPGTIVQVHVDGQEQGVCRGTVVS